MGKRILITSTDMMMMQFLVPHLENLRQHGYEMDVACSNVGGRIEEVREKLNMIAEHVYEVGLVRTPFTLKNVKGYRELKALVEKERYDIIWTNEPVMGVITRMAVRDARKSGTKVLYMVHGFHFYKGAPIQNWLLYYPVECFMARYCDEIVTINKEDLGRARHMKTDIVRCIHGIGVNTDRLSEAQVSVSIRKELGIGDDSFIILSVGELLPRKNHQVIIKALGKIKDQNIHYLICGKGKLDKKLKKLADKSGISGQVHFLGYRSDVLSICKQADVFAFPSLREGLGLAGLEAMLCGIPILSSDTSGPREYMENGKTGFVYPPKDASGFAKGICRLRKSPKLRKKMGEYNSQAVRPFCMDSVKQEVLNVISELVEE